MTNSPSTSPTFIVRSGSSVQTYVPCMETLKLTQYVNSHTNISPHGYKDTHPPPLSVEASGNNTGVLYDPLQLESTGQYTGAYSKSFATLL